MNKYKVEFSGFSYVEAEDEEEAMDIYFDCYAYMEYEPTRVEKVNDFIVQLED